MEIKENLSTTELKALAYLKTPRTAAELAEHLNHKTNPYGILRFLQRMELVNKISKYERAKATFVAAEGDPGKIIEAVTIKNWPHIQIKAHNPFGI